MTTTQRIPEEQLTAYVMGELPAADKARVDAALRDDPELRAEVDEIRKFCGTLWQELQAEPAPSLEDEQREALKAKLRTAPPRAGSKVKWWQFALPSLAAAAAVYVLVLPRLDQGFVKDPVKKTPVATKSASGEAEEVRYVQAAPEPEAKQDVAAPKDKAKKEVLVAEKKPAPVTPSANVPSGRKGSPVADMKLAGPSKSQTLALESSVASGGIRAKTTSQPMEKRRFPRPVDGMYEGEMDGLAHNTEAYDAIKDNPFKSPAQDPLSTFSVDVDTASYANLRRYVAQGSLPPKDAVRIEELLNYFRYDYAPPTQADRPFSVNVETTAAPWAKDHRLVRIGLKGKDIEWGERPASNLVFLIDVSGSMNDASKLPLVKQSLKLLVDNLGEKDRVAIVVYAGASGLALPSTPGSRKQDILDALEKMQAGGSTNGAEGLRLAYKTAKEHFIKGGVNRVMICTDGDFNVGVTSQGDLVRLIEDEAKSGVFLSVFGYGMGNIKDSTLEKLADKGNGHYAYIDTVNEARKTLVEEAGGTLVTIAKDVKLQLEFNPDEVNAYRLIGYENRVMAHEDFNNDAKDAGDIGAGHVVTALYEVVPKGVAFKTDGVDPLKYQKPAQKSEHAGSGELLTLKLRFKKPDASKSSLIEYTVKDGGKSLQDASDDTRWAAAVAAFGMLLRDSEHKGGASYSQVLSLAEGAVGSDKGGYRKEFIELVRKAQGMSRR